MLRHVLLEDVVLNRSPEQRDIRTLALGGGNVEAEQHRRRAIDGHRRGDPVHGNPIEQHLHVREGGDGDPALPHFALRPRMVGVVAHERGEIKRYGEARLSPLQQELVTPIGVLRRSKTRELPHRPEPPPIHRGVDAPGVRVQAGMAQLVLRVEVLKVDWCVERVHFRGALGDEVDIPFRCLVEALAPVALRASFRHTLLSSCRSATMSCASL